MANVISTMPASPNKRYDMFKNIVPDVGASNANTIPIKQILANLSVSDTSHDIDTKDDGILGITNRIENDKIIKGMYNDGIPLEFNNIFSEEGSFSMVIDRNSFQWINPDGVTIPEEDTNLFKAVNYAPLHTMKYIKEGKLPNTKDKGEPSKIRMEDKVQHSIETINGNKYTVTYFDVKPENPGGVKGELIGAERFFQLMGYDTTTAKNIAFVVDCTSIKFEDILNNGTRSNDNLKAYLIKAPEVENDPGGKTNLQSSTFNKAGGVIYKPAVPFELDKTNYYNYSFNSDGKGISPYTQFFTNYIFELSELQFDDKYIFSSLNTKLTITNLVDAVPKKIIPDSGLMNTIKQVSTAIRNVLLLPSYAPGPVFDFNCAVQQKRSGDWLQALLCCLVASEQRKFCQYDSPAFSIGNIFKKKDVADGTLDKDGKLKPSLTFLPDDVYLVTHDRILLSFALLLGINVIYTHHYKASGKNHSYHSAIIYKIPNPREKAENRIQVMKDFNKGILPDQNYKIGLYLSKLTLIQTDLNKAFNIFNNQINQINEINQINLMGKIIKDDNSQININDINTNIQNIFSNAFKINLIRSTFPELNNLNSQIPSGSQLNTITLTAIQKLIDILTPINRDIQLKKIKQLVIHPNSSINPLPDDPNEYYITLPNESRIIYDDIVNIISEYNRFNKKAMAFIPIRNNFPGYIAGLDKNFKKNPAFGLITSWKASNSPKLNLWVEYNNVITMKSAYINDKNIFLYSLTQLTKTEKEQICQYFYNLYQKVKLYPNSIIGTSGSLHAKIISNLLSFCLEVFINLGPDTSTLNNNIKTIIDTYLTEQASLADNELRFKNVIAELNALNTKAVVEISPPVMEIDKTYNSDNHLVSYTGEELTTETVNVIEINKDNVYNPIILSDIVLDTIETIIDNIIKKQRQSKNDPSIEVQQDSLFDKVFALNKEVNSDTGEQTPINLSESVDSASGLKGGNYQKNMVGGLRNAENISFTFYNNIAPRYIAASNLFRPSYLPYFSEKRLQDLNNILTNSQNIDIDEEIYPGPDIDNNLLALANNPTVIQTVNRYVKFAVGVGATAIMYTFLVPRLVSVNSGFFGGNNKIKSKNKNIVGGTKTIMIEGEWVINIIDDTHITLCNQDNKCYPILLQEGEIQKVKIFLNNSESEIDNLISSQESILINEKIAPHPLLSIYLVLESYCQELSVTSIEDSWDYENFVYFFTLANKLINVLLNIYSGDDKNTNINKLRACMIGYGLRELIFTSPQYVERDPICIEALSLHDDTSNYNQLSKLFSILVNRVCGIVNQTPEDIQLGNEFISSPIFKEYADKINFRDILNSDVPDVDTYQLALKSNELFLEIGRKIISDTNGEVNNTLLDLTSNNQLPLKNNLKEETPSLDISAQNDPYGFLERKKQIEQMPSNRTYTQQEKTGSQEMRERQAAKTFEERTTRISSPPSSGNVGEVISSLGSDSSSSPIKSPTGGKKTRKHKRHLKNKRTKRRNSRTKRRITKKHKRARKNNKSRK